MNGYERLIKTIRAESGRGVKSFPVRIGEMTSSKTCSIGQIELDSDDLYIAEHLTRRIATGAQGEYIEPLKTGDLVVLAQASSDKFIIIDRIKEV